MTTLILVSRSERSPSLKVYYNHVVLHSSAHVESKSAEGEAVRYFFFAGKVTHVCLPQIAGLVGFARKLSPKVEQLRYSRRLQWSAGAIKLVFSIMTTLHYIQTCSDFVETAKQYTIPRAFTPESSKSHPYAAATGPCSHSLVLGCSFRFQSRKPFCLGYSPHCFDLWLLI